MYEEEYKEKIPKFGSDDLDDRIDNELDLD